jgi:hypothetical protein
MLQEISNSLRRFIVAEFPEISGDGWVEIMSAASAAGLPAEKLVVLLYAVEEAPYVRNEFHAVVDRAGQAPALALNLRYLIVFNSMDHVEAQRRLSRVLESFHQRPLLGPEHIDPALADRLEHLSVRLHNPTVEELNLLWTALNVGMRLALHYEVSVTLVDPNAKQAAEEEAATE